MRRRVREKYQIYKSIEEKYDLFKNEKILRFVSIIGDATAIITEGMHRH
jgi:hypothetical protein